MTENKILKKFCDKTAFSSIVLIEGNKGGRFVMKKSRMITIGVVFCVAAVSILLWMQGPPSLSFKNCEEVPLKVTLLKVGKADAIALQTEGETMVIDAGEEEDGEEMVMFLKNQGITRVDTLIITHFDRDHVGGADIVAEEMDVGTVVLPDYEGTNTEYEDFMDVLGKKGITPRRLTEPEEYTLGEAHVLVEPPHSYETKSAAAEFDNNFSLIATVTHGENRLLFMGDAEKQRIREWIAGENAAPCKFLKIPHHGVYNTALKELMETVSPDYAVICSSNKNPAEVETLELLKKKNISVFQTKDGNVTVISDGKKLELNQKLEH